MKKIQILGIALVALFAFSAISATLASAETTLLAEWLVNGVGVTTLTSVEISGELLLSDTSNGSDVICSGILDGSVGPSGEDEITEVLSLAGVAASLAAPLLCKRGAVCEESATDIEVAPEGLPFHTLLFLMENGEFLDLVSKAGYSVKCLVLGIAITDECTVTNGAGKVTNVAGGVEGAALAIEPLGTCSIGGAGTGELVPQPGNVEKSLTGTLSVSSE